jgi:hypothetical protein
MLTRSELAGLRDALASRPDSILGDPDAAAGLLERLLRQGEYALDCAALLDEACHYPADPYGEAEVLVSRLTDGMNEIWNRHHYGNRGEGLGCGVTRR